MIVVAFFASAWVALLVLMIGAAAVSIRQRREDRRAAKMRAALKAFVLAQVERRASVTSASVLKTQSAFASLSGRGQA